MTAPASNWTFPAFSNSPVSPSLIGMPTCRLTLAANTPVMMATVAAAANVYLTNRCLLPIWNGQQFVLTDPGPADLVQATTDATKSPAAVAATSIYDMFVWNDNGTIRCTRGPAWASASARTLALSQFNGVQVNSAAITNGPLIYQGTYVGTIQSNAAGTIDWILGTGASGGGCSTLSVWNMYNRKQIATRVTDTGVAYTYTTATVRQARASNGAIGGATGNNINYVAGLAEDCITAAYQQDMTLIAAVAAKVSIGVGDDTITIYKTVPAQLYTNVAVAITAELATIYHKGMGEPMIGSHYVAALEKGDGTNANSFNISTLGELSFSFMM